MKLAAGTRLGPYEIRSPIGAGGMGVVYRADDSRLGRKVAIKILPEETAASQEHLKRFEREARTIGSLNHPNLLTLYDIGYHEGAPYLVTELLEGESLRVYLAKLKKLPLRKALQIAADVARGLAAAHGAGVIHRDIKPDNIYLTNDGRVKILDFGIAKLLPPEVAERISRASMALDVTADPGLPKTATTDTGLMIGTPGYMSPEQLDGANIDERTDIFSFGVVLYELITGVRAFASTSPIEESYAILKATPEPPEGSTPAVARIVMRCLEKRPDARFQSAQDLAFALDEIDASTDPIQRVSGSDLITSPQQRLDRARVERQKRLRRLMPRVAVGLAMVAVGLGGVYLGRHLASGKGGVSSHWPELVEGGPAYQRVTYHSQYPWFARLAPDAKSVFYSTYRDGRLQVVRSLIGHPAIVPMNIDGRLADVSKRGELAVIVEPSLRAGGTLSRVFEGQGPRQIADHVMEATWLPDGESLAIIRDLSKLEFPIGKVIVEEKVGALTLLRAAPSGDRFALARRNSPYDTRGRVVVVDTTGKPLTSSAEHESISGVAWSADGKEVWFNDGATMYALTSAGRPSDGQEHVLFRGPIARVALVDAAAGRILVAPTDLRLKMFTGPRGGPYREASLYDGSEVLSLSSDGKTIAFFEDTATDAGDGGYANFVRRGDSPPTMIAHAASIALVPDGSAAIALSKSGLSRVPTGVGTPSKIPSAPVAEFDIGDRITISADGRYVLARGTKAGEGSKLWRFDLTQPQAPPTSLDDAESNAHPLSPDGSLVALAIAEGGIALHSFAGAPKKVLAGTPGEQPVSFTGDGTALFVERIDGYTIEVDRIEIATGARSSWVKIVPEQRPTFAAIALDPTGETIAYSTNSDASDLYLTEPPANSK